MSSSRNWYTSPLSTSLSDCEVFAALFDNTCTSTSTQLTNLYSVPNQTVTCDNVGICDSEWTCVNKTVSGAVQIDATWTR